jgi:hypothetical protein
MADKPQSIRYKFTRAPDYRVLAANGAWGAIATNGIITVDFYVERIANPETIVQYLEGDRAGQEERIPGEPECLIEREAQVGLILTPDTARAIGQWLIERADEYERIVTSKVNEVEEHDVISS